MSVFAEPERRASALPKPALSVVEGGSRAIWRANIIDVPAVGGDGQTILGSQGKGPFHWFELQTPKQWYHHYYMFRSTVGKLALPGADRNVCAPVCATLLCFFAPGFLRYPTLATTSNPHF